jgi:hypothetical protein
MVDGVWFQLLISSHIWTIRHEVWKLAENLVFVSAVMPHPLTLSGPQPGWWVFKMPAEPLCKLFCPKSWCCKGIKLKSKMCTYIFDCPILGPTQHCYSICQWKGGSLQYQTHWVVVCPSRKELFLKWTVFQTLASYTRRLYVFHNLELYCEHNQCHCQLIQIIWFPTTSFLL